MLPLIPIEPAIQFSQQELQMAKNLSEFADFLCHEKHFSANIDCNDSYRLTKLWLFF